MQAALWPVALILTLVFVHTAQAGVHQRVRLPHPGGTVTLRGAVVRGDRDRYSIRVRAGQRLTVRITAGEHNAVFQIISPNGHFLPGAGEGMDAMGWQGRLRLSGTYTIVVGGSRGNATYTLTVSRTP